MIYDIAIIGAGPAGATLARLLDKRYKVMLLDKRNLLCRDQNGISKCCGGLLAPDAQQMLGRLGLAVPTGVLVNPQLFLVRTIDFDNCLERYYQRFYFNMNRNRFDEWLVSLIPDSVDLRMECRLDSVKKCNEGYTVTFIHQGKACQEKARVVVGADGALSGLRKQFFKERDSFKRYIAIQEWFETDIEVPHYGAIFDSAVTDFYSWTIFKEGKLLIGSALIPSDEPRQKYHLLKSKLRDYGFRFDRPLKREAAPILRPCTGDIITGNDSVALIGEAGGFISPSSAEGLSFAFKSAHALALSLNEGMEGFQARYKKRIQPLVRSIAVKRAKNIVMYNKILRGLVMKSGVLSSDVYFAGNSSPFSQNHVK